MKRHEKEIRYGNGRDKSRSEGVKRAPRVNWEASRSRRGPGPWPQARTVHAACRKHLVLQCNIEAKLKKSTSPSNGGDLPRLNVKAGRLTDPLKQGWLGRRHPDLAAAFQAAEQ